MTEKDKAGAWEAPTEETHIHCIGDNCSIDERPYKCISSTDEPGYEDRRLGSFKLDGVRKYKYNDFHNLCLNWTEETNGNINHVIEAAKNGQQGISALFVDVFGLEFEYRESESCWYSRVDELMGKNHRFFASTSAMRGEEYYALAYLQKEYFRRVLTEVKTNIDQTDENTPSGITNELEADADALNTAIQNLNEFQYCKEVLEYASHLVGVY